MTNWQNIWNKKGESASGLTLADLILADGFEAVTGSYTIETWIKHINDLLSEIEVLPSTSFFEVGCGSGAFIYPIYSQGHIVSGIDYSHTLLNLAKQAMPNMEFDVGNAHELLTQPQFDVVLSHGVFHYFDSYDVAREVVSRMIQKSNKYVMILDVPDLATMDESETARRGALGKAEYEAKYKDLKHLYYPRSFFEEFRVDNQLKVRILDQDVKGYLNSKFRFNVILEKVV